MSLRPIHDDAAAGGRGRVDLGHRHRLRRRAAGGRARGGGRSAAARTSTCCLSSATATATSRLAGLADGRYDLRFVLGQVRARTLAVPTGTDQLRVSLARPQGILRQDQDAARRARSRPIFHVVLDRHTTVRGVREHIGRTLRPRLLLWSIRPGTYTVTVWGGRYLPGRRQRRRRRGGQARPRGRGRSSPRPAAPSKARCSAGRPRRRRRVASSRGAASTPPATGPAPRRRSPPTPAGRFAVRGLPDRPLPALRPPRAHRLLRPRGRRRGGPHRDRASRARPE